MEVTDTKPLEKCCSKCGLIKLEDKFIPNRNICKECRNLKCRENYKVLEIDNDLQIKCNLCDKEKSVSLFYKSKKICKDCLNEKRRNHYNTDNDHRLKLIQNASTFKHNKVLERQKKKLEEIGEGNKKCSWCNVIKDNSRFRYNRLKCRDCERDDPVDKFKRIVRGRIWCALTNKTKHTVEYLGCNSNDYLSWILNYNENYNLENRGKEWHIDHVKPCSSYDLSKEDQIIECFNWKNLQPLWAKDNLTKSNKINNELILEHYIKVHNYNYKNIIPLFSAQV